MKEEVAVVRAGSASSTTTGHVASPRAAAEPANVQLAAAAELRSARAAPAGDKRVSAAEQALLDDPGLAAAVARMGLEVARPEAPAASAPAVSAPSAVAPPAATLPAVAPPAAEAAARVVPPAREAEVPQRAEEASERASVVETHTESVASRRAQLAAAAAAAAADGPVVSSSAGLPLAGAPPAGSIKAKMAALMANAAKPPSRAPLAGAVAMPAMGRLVMPKAVVEVTGPTTPQETSPTAAAAPAEQPKTPFVTAESAPAAGTGQSSPPVEPGSPDATATTRAASSPPRDVPAAEEHASEEPQAAAESTAEPMCKLTSLWESRTGGEDPPWTKLARRPSPPTAANDGCPAPKHRWEVKLNKPMKSWMVSDLEFYKNKPDSSDAAAAAPTPLEFEHKPGEKFFSLEELKGMVGNESGIDVANKELYLADADFQASFGMNQEEYSKLPKWRKVLLKKKVGLF